MKIVITTRKPVFDDNLGRLNEGDVVEIADRKANFYIQEGIAMCYQTKVLQDFPSKADGSMAQSSALHQGQVYATKMLSESENGDKKQRGRKKKEL